MTDANSIGIHARVSTAELMRQQIPVQNENTAPNTISNDEAVIAGDRELDHIVAVSEDGDTLQVSDEAEEELSEAAAGRVTSLDTDEAVSRFSRASEEENFDTGQLPQASTDSGAIAQSALSEAGFPAASGNQAERIGQPASGLSDVWTNQSPEATPPSMEVKASARTFASGSLNQTANNTNAPDKPDTGQQAHQLREAIEQNEVRATEKRSKELREITGKEEAEAAEKRSKQLQADKEQIEASEKRSELLQETNEKKETEAAEKRSRQLKAEKEQSEAEAGQKRAQLLKEAAEEREADSMKRAELLKEENRETEEASEMRTRLLTEANDKTEENARIKTEEFRENSDTAADERSEMLNAANEKAVMQEQQHREDKEASEDEDAASAIRQKPSSYAAYTEQQLHQLYLDGTISRYDYESEVTSRKETRETMSEKALEDSRDAMDQEQAFERISRMGDAIQTAYSDRASSTVSAGNRMDALERLENINLPESQDSEKKADEAALSVAL